MFGSETEPGFFEDAIIVLEWSQECPVVDYFDPSYYLTETSGDIHLENALQGADCHIGKFNLFYLDVGAMMYDGIDMSAFDVLDTQSKTSDYYGVIYGECEPDFSEAVNALFGSVEQCNLLILDRLEILPGHRGNGVGLLVMRELIRRFGRGAGVVAIKPFPLQFEARSSPDKLNEWDKSMKFDELPREEKNCTKKLQQYYGRLGFKRLGRSPFMALPTSQALPDVQSLIKPRARPAARKTRSHAVALRAQGTR